MWGIESLVHSMMGDMRRTKMVLDGSWFGIEFQSHACVGGWRQMNSTDRTLVLSSYKIS